MAQVSIDPKKKEMEAPSMKAKLGNAINKSKFNVPIKNNSGFMLNGKKCKGLLSTLKTRFYPNFISKNIKLRYTKSKTKTNGMRVGDLFHRQVYHYFKCYNKTAGCVCKHRFKRRTANVKVNTIHYARILALEKFLKEAQWQVFDCELVAGFSKHKIATAVDMVCVDNILKPQKVYVVELKFGYARGLHDVSSSRAEFQHMIGEAGQSIKNTYANHHQLQLWFEIDAIRKTYDIVCESGAVVYIRDGPIPKKNEKRTASFHAEYAQPWWFRNASTRKNLRKQLFK